MHPNTYISELSLRHMGFGGVPICRVRNWGLMRPSLPVMPRGCPHAGVIQTWENTIEGLNVGSAKFVNQKQEVRESDPEQYHLLIQHRRICTGPARHRSGACRICTDPARANLVERRSGAPGAPDDLRLKQIRCAWRTRSSVDQVRLAHQILRRSGALVHQMICADQVRLAHQIQRRSGALGAPDPAQIRCAGAPDDLRRSGALGAPDLAQIRRASVRLMARDGSAVGQALRAAGLVVFHRNVSVAGAPTAMEWWSFALGRK
ncbi:Uncharacterized protein Adt_33216 [Abeliophyllum distichum]|uniref:Uncharacterized protein n=1 Tax=Abeliophyllum distichum TaxID=126358 RepID=A0ABD1QVL5_9LAMI